MDTRRNREEIGRKTEKYKLRLKQAKTYIMGKTADLKIIHIMYTLRSNIHIWSTITLY